MHLSKILSHGNNDDVLNDVPKHSLKVNDLNKSTKKAIKNAAAAPDCSFVTEQDETY